MFFPEGQVRVFLYGKPVDMRKSFTGLYALTKGELKQDPLSGHLFVFVNRRGDYLKCLYFDRTGFCLWAKRLKRGQFHPHGQGDKRRLGWTELKLILEGIDLRSIRRFKCYQRPGERAGAV